MNDLGLMALVIVVFAVWLWVKEQEDNDDSL